MRKIVALSLLLVFMSACDDGDVIVTTFNFEDITLQTCNNGDNYVFFKINSTSAESLSLQITATDAIFMQSDSLDFALNETSNIVNYRIYTEAITSSYFCNSVPPTAPLVTLDYISTSGKATLVVDTTLDDNDGLEEDNTLEVDSDLDGLLNFYDFDDDGDNVPTAVELGSDPENPMDSDGDTIFDYLDTDDDGDGVLTRNEGGGSLDPTTMITDPTVGPDYLNPDVTNEVITNEYREHNYNLASNVEVFLLNLVFMNGEEEIIREFIDLGEITNVITETILVTPKF